MLTDLILDRRALGLHPDWENILIGIIDIELNLNPSPNIHSIMKFMLDGYTIDEIADILFISKRSVYREINKIRQV